MSLSVKTVGGGGISTGTVIPNSQIEPIRDPSLKVQSAFQLHGDHNPSLVYTRSDGTVFSCGDDGKSTLWSADLQEKIWSKSIGGYRPIAVDDEYAYWSYRSGANLAKRIYKQDLTTGTTTYVDIPSLSPSANYFNILSFCDSKNYLWLYVTHYYYESGDDEYYYSYEYDRVVRISKSDLTITTVWTGTSKKSGYYEYSWRDPGNPRVFALVAGYQDADNIIVLKNEASEGVSDNEFPVIEIRNENFEIVNTRTVTELEYVLFYQGTTTYHCIWTSGFVSKDESYVFVGGGSNASGSQCCFALPSLELIAHFTKDEDQYMRCNPKTERILRRKQIPHPYYNNEALKQQVISAYTATGELVWSHGIRMLGVTDAFSAYLEDAVGDRFYYQFRTEQSYYDSYNQGTYSVNMYIVQALESPITGYKIKEA